MRDSQASPPPSRGASPLLPLICADDIVSLLEVSPDAMVIVDQAGHIAMANAQAEELFGYAHGELVGQPLEVLLPQRYRATHAAHRQRFFSAPRRRPMGVELQLVGRRRDGSEFPVEISLNPMMLDRALHVIGAIRDMSAKLAAQQVNLQQSRRIGLQAELINLAHDAILVRDPLSRVLSWNKGAEELYGWSEQETLGRVSHTLLRTRFPLDRADIDAQLERSGLWEGELAHTCRDGRVVTVESRQVLVRDEAGQPSAVLEINRNITERREIEQVAQTVFSDTAQRLAFLRQVLDALPSGVTLVHGPDARLLLTNRAAEGVWGAHWQADQPMDAFLAEHDIMLFDAQGRKLGPEQLITLRALRFGETALQQETVHRPDGSRLPILVSALPLPPQEGSGPLASQGEALALVVHQDVTALKEAEALKDEFVGIVAHELRTPLAALRGFADMLLVQTARHRGPALTDWQREALQEIGVAVERMVTLTEDLLDVTRLQTGRLQLQRTPTNLVSLAQHAASLLQKSTTRHQIELRAAREQLVADIDPGRIEQVLTNLIGNAIKYSPQGGPVTVSLWEDADAGVVGVSVRDRGIGIPASQQGLVFGRFMRADNAAAWGIGGSGLGLYISRELVERHEGRLWFESAEGEGSTFHVSLSAIPEAVQAARGPGQVPRHLSSQQAPARARQYAADDRGKAT